jgi:hypothetical protein
LALDKWNLNKVWVVVGNQVDVLLFFRYNRELVLAQSSFVYEQVGNLLSMHNGFTRVIGLVSLAVFHAELNSIHSVVNSEPWVNYTFDGRNHFLVLV